MSKYHELALTLRRAMEDGTYEAGSRLPTTPELCEIYQVSNTTVKKAMDELEQLGLVARRRGSGIYVKSTTSLRRGTEGASSTAGQMTGFVAEHAGTGVVVTSDVHGFSVVHPPEAVAEELDIRQEEFVYSICRVRLTDGVPRNVEYTYMPIKLVPDLRERNVETSIYGYLEGELGLKIGSAHRVIKAVLPTDDEATWLGVDPSQPLLEVKQVGFLDDGVPFEWSVARHANDYEFCSISTHN